MDTRTPVKSSMSFVAPDSIVNPSPSIRNLMNDPAPKAAPAVVLTVPVQALAPESAPVSVPAPEVSEPIATPQLTEPQSATSELATPVISDAPHISPSPQPEDSPHPEPTTSSAPLPVPIVPPEGYLEKFKEKWNEMVDNVFNKVPTLQAPLKNYPLELRNNTIYLKLRNSMQVDSFSIKKIAVLQYLRNQFDSNINDVEVELDDKTEAKKYILDEKDKIKELQHQNPDFAEFMQTLNLQSCN